MKDPASHLNRHAAERFKTYGTWPGNQSVYGYQLEPGDVLEATDVYDSTSGSWEPCPVPGFTRLYTVTGPGSYLDQTAPVNKALKRFDDCAIGQLARIA